MVVFVPGVTGSKLRDSGTRKTVFGVGTNVIWPHDGGYELALPIVGSGDNGLEPYAVVDRVTLSFRTLEVFGPMIELLEANGYQVGDLDAPELTDTFFPFPYDWRRNATESARQLSEKLSRLRRLRGDHRLPVALICQSTGTHVCRYLAKYGDATLDEAAAGRAGPLPWLNITRLVLVASSNGGSMRILREIDRGRRYIRLYGRVFRPEVFFTFRSLYEDLPCWQRDRFVDTHGEHVEVELCDEASWERYGWSAFKRDAARRIGRGENDEIFGTVVDRRRYLRAQLEHARTFQELLQRDVEGFGPTQYFLFQDRSRDTPDKAVLVNEGEAWRTLFTGDREVEQRPALREQVTALGDGHATVESQLRLSHQERASMAMPPTYVHGGHFELIHDLETSAALLKALDERPPRP